MLRGLCVPVTTPNNYFELAVKRERQQAANQKQLVKRQQSENQNRADAAKEI